MFDIVALGELLIDFTPAGSSGNGNVLFERNPGGAPANVLATLSKFGRRAAFIGKVGNDEFGHFLKRTLDATNIDSTGLVQSNECPTTLAFVHLREDGDRTFSFYRNPGADVLLSEGEVNFGLLDEATIFHFGSVSMTHDPVRTATFKAADYAKRKGVLVSYDPNLRVPLWASLEDARTRILKGMEYADIVKISEEELSFITGTDNLEEGTANLLQRYPIQVVFVTLGPNGCFFRTNEFSGSKPGYRVSAVDTTGAGDAFFGSIIHQILHNHQRSATAGKTLQLTKEQLETYVDFANAVGALTTTKQGAIPAIPSLEDVEKFQKVNKPAR